MTQARHLTKRYGHTVAVVDAFFTVRPGRVTGCLGPERAGKPTTTRMILGLDAPSSDSVLAGQPCRKLTDPPTTCSSSAAAASSPTPAQMSSSTGTAPAVRVRDIQQDPLADALTRRGAELEAGPGGALVVTGLEIAAITRPRPPTAHPARAGLHRAALKEAFSGLTRDETGYRPASWPVRRQDFDLTATTYPTAEPDQPEVLNTNIP